MLEKIADQELMGLTPTVLLFHFPHPGGRSEAGPRPRGSSANASRRNPPQVPFSNQPQGFFYHAVWDGSGGVVAQSSSFPEEVTRPGSGEVGWEYRYGHNMNRELIHRHPSGYIGIVGTSASRIHEQWLTYCYWTWGIGFVVVLTAWLVGWKLVDRSLNPLRRISETARDIAEGDLDKRIDTTKAHEELQDLAGTLNRTFERLGMSLTQQIRFTADASHELRTPLTIVLSECQWALDRERSMQEYREGFETCQDTAQHMRGLVEALMQLARIDAGQEKLICKVADLKPVMEGCVGMLESITRSKQIVIETDFDSVRAEIDASKIQQVVINIVSNAVDHSSRNSTIFLSLTREDSWAVITITDQGEGIPGGDLSQIFERFYQSSESRSESGAGLGLAISKSIIDLHGGQIEAVSNEGSGTSFIIKLPYSG